MIKPRRMGPLGTTAILTVVIVVLVACGDSKPTPTTVAPTPNALLQPRPTARPVPTPTPVPTATVQPTSTVQPMATPIPDATAILAPTATPVRASIRPFSTPTPLSVATQVPDPSSTPTIATPTPSLTIQPSSTPEPAPVPQPTPEPTPEPESTAAPDLTPTQEPTPRPTQMPTPTPRATPVPQSEPTAGLPNVVNEFGFVLKLDQPADIQSAGWTGPQPDQRQGTLSISDGGLNTFLIWGPREGRDTLLFLADTYNLLRGAQPQLTFEPISEGDIAVSGELGVFGGFRTLDGTEAVIGGGLIGAWVCPGRDTAYRLALTGVDSTVVQVRFNRLLSNFTCSS